MCYHFSIPEATTLEKRFQASFDPPREFQRVYHTSAFVKPVLPVITNHDSHHIQMFTWGLIPFWVKPPDDAQSIRMKTFNARAETIHEKVAFRHAIKNKRCLVLADGFFEWHHLKGKTYPYYIQLRTQQPFAFAGIWDTWQNPEVDTQIHTFSIITTQANPLLERIHNKNKRMPVILHRESEKRWLQDITTAEVDTLLTPFPEKDLKAHPISHIITARTRDSNVPEVVDPVEYPKVNLP